VLGSVAAPITSVTINANITPVSLTVSSMGTLTKIYDGLTATVGTAAEVGQNNYSIAGLISMSDKVVISNTSALYNNANVSQAHTVAVNGLDVNNVSGGMAQRGDYSIGNSSIIIPAQIMPGHLTVNAVSFTKVFDGTTDAPVQVIVQQNGSTFTFSESFVSAQSNGTDQSVLVVNQNSSPNYSAIAENYSSVTFNNAIGTILPLPQIAGGGLPVTTGFFGAGSSSAGGGGGSGGPVQNMGQSGGAGLKLDCASLISSGQCGGGAAVQKSPRFIQSRSFDFRL